MFRGRYTRVAVFGGVLLVLGAGAGHSSEPLYVKNLSPVSGLLGLPSQRDAHTPDSGSFDLALHTSIASHYVSESNFPEAVNFDGETLRFAIEARYGLADNWDLQLEVPWLDHSGGELDGLIDGWHDFWGMPDGGRDGVERDLLDYRYSGPGGQLALVDDASGMGDITVSLNHAFYRSGDSTVALAAGYKFGTGEEQEFLGSGADDAYITLRFSGAHLAELPLIWHGQLGYLRAGNSAVMGEDQARDIWFAGLAMDWALTPAVSLIGQVDAHAAPMDSALTALGDEAILLSLGARWCISPGWSIDLNFVEDIAVETAPDITFQASLRYFGQARR